MGITDPALTQLIGMLTKAALRQLARMVKRPLGAFFAIFMLVVFSAGAIPNVMLAISGQTATGGMIDQMGTALPLMMYAGLVMLILGDGGDSLLELRPPELQFVLAGPFSDAQILSYRLLTLALGWIPISFLFTLFLLPQLGSLVGGVVGITCGGAFLTLLSLMYTLSKPNLPGALVQTIRVGMLLVFLAVAAETALTVVRSGDSPSPLALAKLAAGGWVASITCAIFQPFTQALQSGYGIRLSVCTCLSLSMVVLAIVGCYRVQTGFAEMAVAGVTRRQAKLDRIKSGNLYSAKNRKATSRWTLPSFKWLCGVGPVAWLQILSALRRTGRMLPGLLGLSLLATCMSAAVLSAYPGVLSEGKRQFAVPIALGISAYVCLLVSLTIQTGFNASERLLTWYRTLPLRPISIAIGMAAGTSVVLITIQTAVFLPALMLTSRPLVESFAVYFAVGCFLVSYATQMNLVSVTFQLRPMPQGTPDVFQGARAMLYMMALSVAMLPAILFALGGAGIAGAIIGFSITNCAIAAGLMLLAIQPAFWWLTGDRFISRDSVD